MNSAEKGDSKKDVNEVNTPLVKLFERKAEAALPDYSKDSKVVDALTTILHPVPVGEIDPNLCCPITHMLMREPVQASDEQTYENEAILKWLENNNTSPVTRAILPDKRLVKNIAIKKIIDDLVTNKQPALKDSTEWHLPASSIQRLENALKAVDEKSIRDLVKQDRRLLVHPVNAEEQRAIHLAATGHIHSLKIVIELLENRQKGLGLQALLTPDKEGLLPIHRAIFSKQPADVLLLLCDWMGKRQVYDIPLSSAVLIKLLSQYEENRGLNDALRISVIEENDTNIDFLLRHGAECNTCNDQGESLVYLAVKHSKTSTKDSSKPSILRMLLDRKADPNKGVTRNGLLFDTPLHAAVSQGDVEAVAALREHGALLNVCIKDGIIPLHLAAEQSNTKIADALYENNVLTQQELEAKSTSGFTPLCHALWKGQRDMVTWLITRKADIHANNKGASALHVAAGANNADGIKQLLASGAILTVKNEEGNNPLHFAAMYNAIEAMEFLLREGLFAGTLNKADLTAQQLARDRQHLVFIERQDKIVNELRAEEEKVLSALVPSGRSILTRIQERQAYAETIQSANTMLKQTALLDKGMVSFLISQNKEREKKEAQNNAQMQMHIKEVETQSKLKHDMVEALRSSQVKDAGIKSNLQKEVDELREQLRLSGIREALQSDQIASLSHKVAVLAEKEKAAEAKKQVPVQNARASVHPLFASAGARP